QELLKTVTVQGFVQPPSTLEQPLLAPENGDEVCTAFRPLAAPGTSERLKVFWFPRHFRDAVRWVGNAQITLHDGLFGSDCPGGPAEFGPCFPLLGQLAFVALCGVTLPNFLSSQEDCSLLLGEAHFFSIEIVCA